MYQLFVTLKDGTLRSDFSPYRGTTPQLGSEISHQVGMEIMRLRITSVRSPMPIGPSTTSVDLVDTTQM
jgi:hypothetical protein